MEYRLKKSLGQHFLKDESICRKIVDALNEHSYDRLLEVGPGGGALTRFLLQHKAVDFKAVELDDEKIIYLLKSFPALTGKLINQDFLDMAMPFDEAFTVVGNFPYNISTQILFRVLEWKQFVPTVIGMFQKEVAQRAASREGSKVYGVLSVLVQAFYSVEYLFDVDPSSFNPPPKVMSGVIRLTRRNDVPEMRSEKAFFNLVKTAFNQRRKTMRNAVKGLFSADELKDELFLRRAETLSVAEFAALTFRMS